MLSKKRISTTKVKKSKSFLLSLFEILNDINYNEIIHWNFKGDSLIIEDIDKFSNRVLPKFYIHNKYSSFIRQLNIYGFHKNKECINEEIYKCEKFNKNCNKEQIKNIVRKNRKNKLLSKYNKDNEQFVSEDDEKIFPNNNGNDLIKLLLYKNKEDQKNLIDLKKEYENLKNINQCLKQKFNLIKNNFFGNGIIIKKIISYKTKNKNILNARNKKVRNIADLFRKYLFYLRIYSPYIFIKKDSYNNSTIKFFNPNLSKIR